MTGKNIFFRLWNRPIGILVIFAAVFSASAVEFQKVHVKNGTLLFEDGSEAVLWGVNFQPSLSWEYQRMAQHGLHVPFDQAKYQAMINEAFDEIQRMDCNLIRIHLSPADISGPSGDLVENEWLDALDYVMAEAEGRGVYVYLAFLNNLGGVWSNHSFVRHTEKDKAHWMIDPEFMAKADNYIRQVLNRKNPYLGKKKYKASPALVIVEPINEPGYFKREELAEVPACEAVYQEWLKDNREKDEPENYTAFRIENTKNYINRMKNLFDDEGCAAVMSWSMEWPRMMEWTGEDVFEAAAESDADVLSVCLYPGQSASHNKKGEDLKAVGEINYLKYIQQAYDDTAWHGWLREKRFKDKARIVYEFETYYNQSSYLYPAMAKYFRAQGVQAAAMWTYILPGQAEYTAAAHNLNLKTTPNKAAAFMAAGEVFRNVPRFEEYQTSSAADDFFENTALSYETGCSAYADDKTLIYSETMPESFVRHLIDKDSTFERIIGHGSSPVASYGGTGLYFIEPAGSGGLSLEITPDAEFIVPHYLRNKPGEKAIELKSDVAHPFELNFPGIGKNAQVFCSENGRKVEVEAEDGSLKFNVAPGRYLIREKADE